MTSENNECEYVGIPIGKDMLTSAYIIRPDGTVLYDKNEAEESARINGSKLDPQPRMYMAGIDRENLKKLLKKTKKENQSIGFNY